LAVSLRFLPVSLFGAVMGLAGLGLAWRAAAGMLGLPAAFAELWIALAAAAFACLLPAFVLKALRYPQAVREELSNPALLGFCATLPVGMTLLAGGLQPHVHALADALWWSALALLLSLQLWMLARLLKGGVKLAQVNGGWMIVLVGGIVVPSSGLPLGHPQVSLLFFSLSALAAAPVMGLVLYRMLWGPPMPDAVKPTWFIVLVPPSLIYLNGAALTGEPAGIALQALYLCGLPLAVVLLLASRGLLRWPFGSPWWAFTFPLDALAAASAQFAREHGAQAWVGVAGAALLLAVLFVAWVLVRTIAAIARGTLFSAPR
jgi:tellurite resistance protein